jgi:tetratricopeptide (TPR) repeat protein
LLTVVPAARGGLYYSGEQFAELPSQWRGFLIDVRALRGIGIKPAGSVPASPLRKRYLEEAERLEKATKTGKLSADELADLGAVLVRLGEVGKAIDVLRAAQRVHPRHFRIVANLGTAWQLQGDLDQSAACLKEAVRLAPGKWQKTEEYHLKLIQLRQRQPKGSAEPDDLFGVRYVGPSGKYEPGKIASAERKKLPANAVAIAQQLLLWLPSDGRLLWQLAELANADGDVRIAAAILDGCVSEFGLSSPELRRRRQMARTAADALKKNADQAGSAKAVHEGQHVSSITFRSKRPLLSRLARTALPPIDPKGVNPLPWSVLAETSLDRQYKPTFAKHLQALNGKQVELTGYMQPLGDDLEAASFMLIEYPVGCWYCEMPEITGILLVDLPEGKTADVTRGRVKVRGTLTLNATDPENFLYTITKTKVLEDK